MDELTRAVAEGSRMSSCHSDYSDSENGEDVRVVWRTGPTQKAPTRPFSQGPTASHRFHFESTPKSKRPTKTAGLPSPSAPGSSGEPPRRETKKTKKKGKLKKRGCLAAGVDEGPMDQKTLQLVSQLAMKVQARSQPAFGTPPPVRKQQAGEVSGSGARTRSGNRKDTALTPKVGRLHASPSSSRAIEKLCFPTTKSSTSKETSSAKLSTTTRAPTPPLPQALPSPRQHSIAKVLDPQQVKQQEKEEQEEDDFDSYFEDFDPDTLELALSQVDDSKAIQIAGKERVEVKHHHDGGIGEAASSQVAEGRKDVAKQRETEELARKEIASLGDLSDWGSDDDF